MHSHSVPVSRVFRLVAAALLAVALNAPGSAPAQQPAAPAPAAPPGPPAPASPLPLPLSGLTQQRYFESLRREFVKLDADRDGIITPRDVDLHALMQTVVIRNLSVQFVMQYDLDGDGAVTEDEIRRAMNYYLRSGMSGPDKIDGTVRTIMALDTDRDGKVSVTEAGKHTSPEMRMLGSGGEAERTRRALTLKSGAGGELTRQDYEAAGEALFRKIDADQDGKISQGELDDFRRPR